MSFGRSKNTQQETNTPAQYGPEETDRKRSKRARRLVTWGLVALLLLGGCALTDDADTPSDNASSQLAAVNEVAAPSPDDALQEPEDSQPPKADAPAGVNAPEQNNAPEQANAPAKPDAAPVFDLSAVPAFSGDAYVAVNDNIPGFTDADLTMASFERYSSLDSLGRCGAAYACIGTDLMPTGERGSIGQVKPSGWHTVKYDCVDGKYLYNRCHLIGYQLTAENANTKNLITGTRYLNMEGMLPFENMVADYVKETGNHVLYRVTPVFQDKNLVASGVQIEAESVEDAGAGILFNVYCYNVQPGVTIDYATGESKLDETAANTTAKPQTSAAPKSGAQNNASAAKAESAVQPQNTAASGGTGVNYILNTNTKKFHYPSCSSVSQMSAKNKKEYTGSRDEVIAMGYDPCKRCNP